MKSAAAPSVKSKLALAVVTEPERSETAWNAGRPVGAREDALRLMLQTAADGGMGLVATRPEGDVERLLGQAWPFPTPFQVTVRTVALSEGLDRVEARARRSLERMGLPRGDTLLIGHAGDLAGADGRALWDRLRALKDRGLFRRIGFCATMEDSPALLARRYQPDVVQLPCNLLDQRAHRTGVLDTLAEAGVAVHASSVFADGVLFISGDSLPPEMAVHAHALSRIRRRLAEARIDPMQATLAYTLGLPQVSAVIASVASAAEVRAVLAASHAPAPAHLDWATMALETGLPESGTAQSLGHRAALSRISSAA
ncbi:aldo/keto reductase [Brevundimonas vitis]|uniref:Aldo/keto reductase n=1 Tax=Brevundimonas vitisensis TaxID=2800818 RepID=A0ABX7BPG6_9CAUL|nr:aldo/keto reductase [Brevundimonas vitisensis]QQQ17385.1 aldo/keto reductase [Brevundimonas vitisensis]